MRFKLDLIIIAALCLAGSLQAEDLAPLQIKLPTPVFTGTPKPPENTVNVEPAWTPEKPRPPFLAPKDITNVALGIAYANHFGKNVLVAGTTDPAHPTAVLVVPPATVRPISPGEPWFRARSGNLAYLMWWGIRHDAEPHSQGYSR